MDNQIWTCPTFGSIGDVQQSFDSLTAPTSLSFPDSLPRESRNQGPPRSLEGVLASFGKSPDSLLTELRGSPQMPLDGVRNSEVGRECASREGVQKGSVRIGLGQVRSPPREGQVRVRLGWDQIVGWSGQGRGICNIWT